MEDENPNNVYAFKRKKENKSKENGNVSSKEIRLKKRLFLKGGKK